MEVAKAQAEYDRYIEETMRQGALLRISNEERFEMSVLVLSTVILATKQR